MKVNLEYLEKRASKLSGRQVSGFTLLETLLALTLTTLLMASIVLSTTLYAQYRQRGLEGAKRAKVLMGTIEDISSDLRACYELTERLHTAAQEPISPAGKISTPTDSRLGQASVLQLATEQTKPIKFVGRGNAILLMRQGTNERFEECDFDPRTSSHQVLWLAPGATTIRLPAQLDGKNPIEKVFEVPSQLNPREFSLHRSCMPVLGVPNQVMRSALTTTSSPTWDKNSAVHRLTFRFFDGVAWRNDWNSHLQDDRLPTAVELLLTLRNSPDQAMRFVLGVSR